MQKGESHKKTAERNDGKRNPLYPARGLLPARHQHAGRRQAYWQMGTDEAEISIGEQADSVQPDDPKRDAENHLVEIDQTATRRLERMISAMEAVERIDENLKSADQMEWVRRMNSIQHRAEEAILQELVFI